LVNDWLMTAAVLAFAAVSRATPRAWRDGAENGAHHRRDFATLPGKFVRPHPRRTAASESRATLRRTVYRPKASKMDQVSSAALLKISVALTPPKPKPFDNTERNCLTKARPGTRSNTSASASGCSRLRLGGTMLFTSDITE
jgi:hypothetical protein